MESPAIARYIPQKSNKRVFPGSSSACMEPEVVEIPPPSDDRTSKSKAKVLKWKEVVHHEVIDVDMDEDCNDVVFIEGNIKPNKKRRGTLGISVGSSAAQVSMDMVPSTKKVESNKGKEVAIMSSMLRGAHVDSLKSFAPGSDNFFDLDDYVSEDDFLALQSHFDNMDIPTGIEASIPWLPETKKKASANRSVTSHTQSEVSHHHMMVDPLLPSVQSAFPHSSLQSQSNAKIIPSVGAPHKIKHQKMPSKYTHTEPGVLKVPPLTGHISSGFNTQAGSGNYPNFSQLPMDTAYPLGLNTSIFGWHKSIIQSHPELDDAYALFLSECPDMYRMEDMLADQDAGNCPRSSSLVGSSSNMARLDNEDVLKRYESFKKFDTVLDHSDHFYATQNSAMKQPPKNWAKKIQEEWRILEKDLPDTIFVRVYESRMDLLRAVIIGAEGTPYHDGLFFFDVCFPSNYPNAPPLVHYHSGGLRINPNLYESGKVCLSLLNTWTGGQKERWVPGTSTMLQVLVSIQGLILNTKPYFNEPGFANSSGSVQGERCSIQYNENTLILSLKTMVYTMKKPPKNFEDLVIGHFRNRVRDILMACKAYTEGVQVGCLVRGGVQDVDEGNKSCSTKFKNDVASCVKILIGAFKIIGAKEADEFLFLCKKISQSPAPVPAPAPVHPHAYPPFPFTAIPYKNYW